MSVGGADGKINTEFNLSWYEKRLSLHIYKSIFAGRKAKISVCKGDICVFFCLSVFVCVSLTA